MFVSEQNSSNNRDNNLLVKKIEGYYVIIFDLFLKFSSVINCSFDTKYGADDQLHSLDYYIFTTFYVCALFAGFLIHNHTVIVQRYFNSMNKIDYYINSIKCCYFRFTWKSFIFRTTVENITFVKLFIDLIGFVLNWMKMYL